MLSNLSHIIKEDLLKFITKWYSILITISLIAYLSFLIGLILISPTKIAFNTGGYESLNYYFFILPLDQEFNTFWRFKAFLMEPGHMMLGTIPLIMANNYNLKNIYVLLLVIVVLFSFSLAGYITAFLGFILLKANKESVKEFVIGLAIVLLVFIIAYSNGMSDFFENYILNRLNQDVGEAVRRTTPAFDKYVFDRVIADPIKNLFGTGLSTAELIDLGGGAGYKPYWSQLGFTGVVLIILSYSSYLMIKPTRKVFAFTLILLLLLAQDSYPTWFCLLIPYILGMGRITYNCKRPKMTCPTVLNL